MAVAVSSSYKSTQVRAHVSMLARIRETGPSSSFTHPLDKDLAKPDTPRTLPETSLHRLSCAHDRNSCDLALKRERASSGRQDGRQEGRRKERGCARTPLTVRLKDSSLQPTRSTHLEANAGELVAQRGEDLLGDDREVVEALLDEEPDDAVRREDKVAPGGMGGV